MTGPITRNENDVAPSAPMPFQQSGVGHSGQQTNTWNVNQPMPWVVLCGILAGISFGFSIPAYIESNKVRAELLLQIQMTEARVLADNREKTTAFALLDNHVKELKGKVEVQEKLYERR